VTVFKLADGRYRAKEGAFQREGKSPRIAKDRLNEAIREAERNAPRPTMLVSACVDLYYQRCEDKNRADKTLRDYRYHRDAIKERIGHMKVCDLDGEIIENELFAGLPDKAKAQINRRAFLRAAINKVIRKKHPGFANPAEVAEPDSYKAKGARPLVGSESARFLKAEENPFNLAMWLLLMDSGIRPDEAYGLMWSEITREDDGWWLYLDESKTEEGKKPIPLSDTSVDALKRIASHAVYVFPSFYCKKIKPYNPTYWCKHFKATAVKAGIDVSNGDVTPYSLRHTFASQMSRKVTDEVLQRLMRHTDIRTTKQYYVEVDKSDLRKAKA